MITPTSLLKLKVTKCPVAQVGYPIAVAGDELRAPWVTHLQGQQNRRCGSPPAACPAKRVMDIPELVRQFEDLLHETWRRAADAGNGKMDQY